MKINPLKHFTTYLLLGSAISLLSLTSPSIAETSPTLSRILSTKVLKCGVELDFPPSGFRNAKNEPDGYDVEYCKDMAKALGAKAEVVSTGADERIPALVSNRIDVLIASASITPQRALTVAFSQPYISFTDFVLTRKDSGIEKFEDMKGRTIGGVKGTTPTIQLRAAFDGWNDPKGKFITYGSEAESYLALQQKKIDALVEPASEAGALIKSGQFPSFAIKGGTPFAPDLCGIAVRQSDTAFLRWIKVFVWNQVRTGRYKELYDMYFGDLELPALNYPGVEF